MKLKGRPARVLSYVTFIFACIALGSAMSAFAQDTMGSNQPKTDPRKLTTIQVAATDDGKTKNVVEFRYLNLPFGAPTFGYMEVGGDRYYSNRTGPILHMKLASEAVYDGRLCSPATTFSSSRRKARS